MTSRTPLIMLVHRIPYPPNKGDKIRSYNLLQALARHHEVHVGTFVDTPEDLRHADALRAHCASLHLETLRPLPARLRALGGLLGGQALTLPWYRSARLRRWVGDTARRSGARRLVAFSLAMAQYDTAMPAGSRRILDMVDVDSDKWRQYSETRRGPAGWIYRREGRRLLAAECAAVRRFDATTLVSRAEVALFQRLCPAAGGRVSAVGNGVDTTYFAPDDAFADPYAPDCLPLVFTGAMDYWPNVDAVGWFADEVLPRVREREPRAVFHIVGSRPDDKVKALDARPGVRVIGPVEDMRPWLQHARLAVAPLRVARGVQNKVLEAFAMGRPLLGTSAALDGLELEAGYPLRADTPDKLAELACRVLQGEVGSDPGPRMQAWVRQHFAWEARLAPLLALAAEPPVAEANAPPTAARARSA